MTTTCRSSSLNPKTVSSGECLREAVISTPSPAGGQSRSGARRYTATGLERDDKLPNIGVSRTSPTTQKKPQLSPAARKSMPSASLCAVGQSARTPRRTCSVSESDMSLTSILSGTPSAAPSPTSSLETDLWNSAHWRHQQGTSKFLTTPKGSPRASFASGSTRDHSPREANVVDQQIHPQHHFRKSSKGSNGSTSCGEVVSMPSSSSSSSAEFTDNSFAPSARDPEDWHRHRSQELDAEFAKLFAAPMDGEVSELPDVDYPTDMLTIAEDRTFLKLMTRESTATSATSNGPRPSRAERALRRLSSTDVSTLSSWTAEEDSDREEGDVETAATGITRTKLAVLQRTFKSVTTKVSGLTAWTSSHGVDCKLGRPAETHREIGEAVQPPAVQPQLEDSLPARAPSPADAAAARPTPTSAAVRLEDVRERVRAIARGNVPPYRAPKKDS
eukprot:gnl/TRDRNA2_/TRDRNA2_151861_c0_seq1.p1 gnl/TRDRNA2_/TRDRNA2_151861_c0~~gnl/TRDRNA2_/TRDRNA2_151861_c0_seq1.p1  ORF type:complete len:446 (+),score=37.73 gnl/TRDRNA2_/TRDRNA2_151861_c0_seq1:57-1394(+)